MHRSHSSQHSARNDTGTTLPGSASGKAFSPCLWLCNTTELRNHSVPKHLLIESQKHPPGKFLDKINRENVRTAWGSHHVAPGGERRTAMPRPLSLPASSSRS